MTKKPQVKKSAGGRPSKLKTINIEHLKFLVEKGCTDEEICQFFKISRSTFYLYQQTVPKFSDTIKGWKQFADNRVERSLYERACGYSHESEQVFCYQGDVVRAKVIKEYPPSELACIMWLKNRKPDQWRETPPPAMDPRFEDAELVFPGVANQRDPKIEQKFTKYYDQN